MLSEIEAIHGIGIEIVEISKMKKVFDKWPNVLGERLFTDEEIKYCLEFFNPGPQFSLHFASKEAFVKALNQQWVEGMKWTDINLKIEKTGSPKLILAGKTQSIAEGLGISKIFISLSHSHEYAIAQVILTKRMQPEAAKI